MNLKSLGAMNQSSEANFNVNSAAQYLETAKVIQMNGALAALAIPATSADISATPALLPLFTLPNRDKDAGWTGGNFYSADSIASIMQRVPTHEPWVQHENLDPTSFSPKGTDTIDGTANKRTG